MAYKFRRSPLTGDQADALASACRDFQERLTIFTLLDTGLRVAEFARISKATIEWSGHRLHINGKRGPHGTSDGKRVVPMSPRVRALIEAHFATQETIGMSPRTIERLVARVARNAGIPRAVSPHVLRHTFAVTALRRGVSLPAIQRLMGHERLSTTEIYLNLSPEAVLAEYDAKF